MKRYSRKVREEAALICAIAASSSCPSWRDACAWLGNDASRVLAEHASYHVLARSRHDPLPAYYAEAEALIRTGWSPS